MANDLHTDGGWRTKATVVLAAVILLCAFLPWTSWPEGDSEPRTYGGFGVLSLGFAAVGESYDTAVAKVQAGLEARRQAIVEAEQHAEELKLQAGEAQIRLLADPGDARAKRDAERYARSAERALEAIEARRAELAQAETADHAFWTHYLFAAFPLAVLLLLAAASATIAAGLLGRRATARALGAATGLLAVLIFLGIHIWFGLPLIGRIAIGGWLTLVAALAIIPSALGLEGTARAIDWINERVGRGVAWLALFMVLVQFALVLMRYVFGVGSIMTQESLVYAHGLLFMLVAGYTLMNGGHVRVDIFYREAAPRKKALVDLFGVIVLLIPVCLLIWAYSLPYVVSSWHVLEGSRETSGIPGIFLLKTAILVFVVLVVLQGVALAIRSALVLAGLRENAGPATGSTY